MSDLIQAVFDYLGEIALFFERLFLDAMEFSTDLFTLVIESVLDAIATIFEAIPVPDFLSVSISDYINSDVSWMLAQSGFDNALGIIGAAITFRIIRRFTTLGIW